MITCNWCGAEKSGPESGLCSVCGKFGVVKFEVISADLENHHQRINADLMNYFMNADGESLMEIAKQKVKVIGREIEVTTLKPK